MVTLPGIPLWFMALGVAMMTPVPASIARPLVDGLGSDSLVQDETARRTFPNVNLIGYEEAVKIALGQLRPDRLEPAWTDCDRPVKFMKHEGFFIDHRCIQVDAAPEKVFQDHLCDGRKERLALCKLVVDITRLAGPTVWWAWYAWAHRCFESWG